MQIVRPATTTAAAASGLSRAEGHVYRYALGISIIHMYILQCLQITMIQTFYYDTDIATPASAYLLRERGEYVTTSHTYNKYELLFVSSKTPRQFQTHPHMIFDDAMPCRIQTAIVHL